MNTLQIFLNARRMSRADQETIQDVQLKRLQYLVDYVREHSAYYRELYRDLPPDLRSVTQLPVTSKPELMSRFNEWVTDSELTIEKLRDFIGKEETIGDMYLGKYYVCTTSGSTGEPAIIVHDQHSRKVYFAIGLFRNLLPHLSMLTFLTRFKMAAVLATGGHFLGYSTMVNRVKKSPYRQKLQKIFSVFTPIADLVRELNSFQPDIIGGYPTVIYLLAKEQLQRRLTIRPYVITSAGETLQPYMRKTMEEAFGCEVINSYGSAESLKQSLRR